LARNLQKPVSESTTRLVEVDTDRCEALLEVSSPRTRRPCRGASTIRL